MALPSGDPVERRRVVIENVQPEVDNGRFAVKRIAGDVVRFEADAYADGHDELAVRLLYKREGEETWNERPMVLGYDDRWTTDVRLDTTGVYVYAVASWPDRFSTWKHDLEKRIAGAQAEAEITLELKVGAEMLLAAAENAPLPEAQRLRQRAEAMVREDRPVSFRTEVALDPVLDEPMGLHAPREPLTVYDRKQRIWCERERARFSAWYELFPRSTAAIPGQHGTFRSAITWLPYVQQMGFDILYLPPIHPIGNSHRKGRNNNVQCTPNDPGSPWAIGSAEGGHKAVNPELGTLADFKALVEAAHGRDMEIALDIAFQCSPDHPYVTEHPEWFKHRPDGSIRYAENPPKKYEDIYPIDFETEDWRALWWELESVIRFWIDQGVKIFRIDNPHTKPYAFWEWLIDRIKVDYPEVLFLAEAFTRPRRMEQLGKLGFSQSYTYFTWRNSKGELTQYMEQLTKGPPKEYFRPNFWPNTPDILHESLQHGGRPAFIERLVLAATLSSSFGIYGPAFELCVWEPRDPGTEEYMDSEKYEIKHWDVDATHSLKDFIARLNRARRDNPALQRNDTLRFLEISNDNMLAYMKTDEDSENVVVIIVNLDPHNTQAGTLQLPWWELGMEKYESYQMRDLIDGVDYSWNGEWNFVELNPGVLPAHIFQLRRATREPSFK